MKHITLGILFCLAIGCGSGDSSTLTQSTLRSLEDGMTLKEVEGILGTDHTTVGDFGPAATHQWVTGEGDSTRTIVVNFTDGKLSMKVGTNLPND
ncbi:MAG: hypothetical protein MK110_15875 [Fuerstiella sp.]|nr:hypothetical protein [Fuerstiella sp.]